MSKAEATKTEPKPTVGDQFNTLTEFLRRHVTGGTYSREENAQVLCAVAIVRAIDRLTAAVQTNTLTMKVIASNRGEYGDE